MAHNVNFAVEGDQLVIRVALDDETLLHSPLSERGNAIVASAKEGRNWAKLPAAVPGIDLTFDLCVVAKPTKH